jgi:hypothetical protein
VFHPGLAPLSFTQRVEPLLGPCRACAVSAKPYMLHCRASRAIGHLATHHACLSCRPQPIRCSALGQARAAAAPPQRLQRMLPWRSSLRSWGPRSDPLVCLCAVECGLLCGAAMFACCTWWDLCCKVLARGVCTPRGALRSAALLCSRRWRGCPRSTVVVVMRIEEPALNVATICRLPLAHAACTCDWCVHPCCCLLHSFGGAYRAHSQLVTHNSQPHTGHIDSYRSGSMSSCSHALMRPTHWFVVVAVIGAGSLGLPVLRISGHPS